MKSVRSLLEWLLSRRDVLPDPATEAAVSTLTKVCVLLADEIDSVRHTCDTRASHTETVAP